MVDEAVEIMMNGNPDDFGLLLNEAWQEKRSLSKLVSNSHVEEIYASAIDSGALGGKLSGAGGGGPVAGANGAASGWGSFWVAWCWSWAPGPGAIFWQQVLSC